MSGRVHVIGAGLAGLSAAVHLCKAGVNVTVHETAKFAGGRCRSFYDETLGATTDNGTHLLLSGNHEVLGYLDLIGARAQMIQADTASFDFQDISNGTTWCVDLGAGQGKLSLLKWLFDKGRRPPGLRPGAFLKDVRRLKRGRGETVAGCVDTSSKLYRTFWTPMTLAVLNAHPEEAAAELIWTVLDETVMRGGAFAKPMFAPKGLSDALVDPALALLFNEGVDVHFQRRITSLDVEDGQISCVNFAKAAEVLSEDDAVIMAVPHHGVAALVDGVNVPQDSHAILNVHYRVHQGVEQPQMVGLVGGAVEWLFRRGPIVSVTISGADTWMDKDGDEIAQTLWPEVARLIGNEGDMPTYRVIKERRATFAATPKAQSLRPGTCTDLSNLYLAGDWTDTGLPASIEGAVKSGRLAAEAVLKARA